MVLVVETHMFCMLMLIWYAANLMYKGVSCLYVYASIVNISTWIHISMMLQIQMLLNMFLLWPYFV